MAERLRAEGFVFKKSDSGEASRIFSVFTKEYGRLEIYGKAIRKIKAKLRGGIELFSFSELEFVQGKHQRTLVDSRMLKRSDALLADRLKTETVVQISQHLDQWLRGSQKDEFLYDVISELVSQEGFTGERQTLLYGYFIWNLFASQGKKPELNVCVLCREKLSADEVYFSFKDGGTLCAACGKKESAERISGEIVKVLRIMIDRDMPTLLRLKTGQPLRQSFLRFSENALAHWAP
jgi:DNA repair protein RecO (recombination protein O)